MPSVQSAAMPNTILLHPLRKKNIAQSFALGHRAVEVRITKRYQKTRFINRSATFLTMSIGSFEQNTTK